MLKKLVAYSSIALCSNLSISAMDTAKVIEKSAEDIPNTMEIDETHVTADGSLDIWIIGFTVIIYHMRPDSSHLRTYQFNTLVAWAYFSDHDTMLNVRLIDDTIQQWPIHDLWRIVRVRNLIDAGSNVLSALLPANG